MSTRLLFSSRTWEDVIYRDELADLAGRGDGFELFHTLTRERPEGWSGYARRVDDELSREVAWPAHVGRACVRLRADRVRRVGVAGLVELGYEPAKGEDGAVRTNGRLR